MTWRAERANGAKVEAELRWEGRRLCGMDGHEDWQGCGRVCPVEDTASNRACPGKPETNEAVEVNRHT
jgi:hypothetical protein